jgi:hypothetical protein
LGPGRGRLPQELRLRGITQLEKANEFLRHYVQEFNQRFSVAAAPRGSAFVAVRRKDLDDVFSLQQERMVNQDNTVHLDNWVFQIEKTRWRHTLAGMTVEVHEHLDGSVTIHYGPHRIAVFAPGQIPQAAPRRRGTPRLPYPKAA